MTVWQKDTSQELLNVYLDNATMKIWHCKPDHLFPSLMYLPLHPCQTWKNSGSPEREKGRHGLEHRHRNTMVSSKFPNTQNFCSRAPAMHRYLLCCTSCACYWNSQRRSSKPISSLHCPALQMPVIDHSEKTSLSKQHPVKIKRWLSHKKCFSAYQKDFLQCQLTRF